jgi:hypothetical protein
MYLQETLSTKVKKATKLRGDPSQKRKNMGSWKKSVLMNQYRIIKRAMVEEIGEAAVLVGLIMDLT